MSEILVTGANGFLGRHVVGALRAEGHAVRAAVRRETGSFPADVAEYAVGDLRGQPDWSSALAGIDHVVHTAGRAHVLREEAVDPAHEFHTVNTAATVRLAQTAAAQGVRRFVFLSTIGVNGKSTRGRPFGPADDPRPHSPYAASKCDAERELRAIADTSGMAVTILRPPLILGADPKGNLALIHRALARKLPLPFALVRTNKRHFISVERLADIIVACLDSDRAGNATLTVADPAPLSTRDFIEREARRLGVKARLLPVPPVLLRLGLALLGKRDTAEQLTGDLEVDGSAADAILAGHKPSSRGAA